MLKRNYFFLIPLLVVMALVLAVPGGAQAKQWPVCLSDYTHSQGPAITIHFDFVIGPAPNNYENIELTGSCQCIVIEEPATLEDTEWSKLDVDKDDLDKADLKGQVFEIASDNDPLLWAIIQACYRDYDVGVVCLKIVSVHNFTANPYGTYSANLTLQRVVLAP